jgi:hypothetical protein
MDHEVIEVTLQVTVDSGYPRENAPLEHEIRAFADRLGRLSSVHGIEATAAHPVDLSREAPRTEPPEFN